MHIKHTPICFSVCDFQVSCILHNFKRTNDLTNLMTFLIFQVRLHKYEECRKHMTDWGGRCKCCCIWYFRVNFCLNFQAVRYLYPKENNYSLWTRKQKSFHISNKVSFVKPSASYSTTPLLKKILMKNIIRTTKQK